MMTVTKGLVVAGVLAVLTGCASQERYYWGNYEPMIYADYVEPGSIDPQTGIIQLEEDIQQANAKGKKVAPGVQAHLGYLYFNTGDVNAAEQAFNAEKASFPESAVMIDGLLKRLKGVQ